MRWAVALVAAAALAGCASQLFPTAWLDAHDAAKIQESIAVRFSLTNGHATEELTVHRHAFSLQGGTGLFTCTNRAWRWEILDDPVAMESANVAAGNKIEGYLEFALCPDVAGPYALVWDGGGRRADASDAVEVRILDSDAPLEPIEILAHSLNETARLS